MRGVLSSPAAKGLAGGFIGMMLVLFFWHLYADHLTLHELDMYIRTVAAPKINKLP